MPRLTRKALENAGEPSRSSPRASTKASSAAAASGSPVVAKAKGRRGKAEADTESPQVSETKPKGRSKMEPESPQVTETKSRGRSASRGKATPTPAPARQSRSRGRNASAEKNAPTPSRKGRGKAKKEESEEEEGDKGEEEEKEEESTGKKSHGRAKAPVKPASKKTPPARGSRSSQRSAQAAEKEEEQEEPKSSARAGRSRGHSKSASGSKSRSRRGRGAAEAEDEEEEGKETVEEKETAEGNKTVTVEEKEAAEDMEKETKDAEEKKMDEGGEVGTTEKKEAKESKSGEAEKKGEVTPAVEKSVPMEEKTASPEAVPENGAVGSAVSLPPKTADNLTSPPKADNSADTVPPTKADNSTTSPPPKTGMKRKLEEDTITEKVEESDTKRARINGTERVKDVAMEAEAVKDETMKTVKVSSKETVIVDPIDVEMKTSSTDVKENVSAPKESIEELQDFVVVTKEELPAPDSAEVAVAVAAAHPMSAKAVTMETEGSVVNTVPPTIVPLTEAELAKAYAKQIKAADRMETDDVSSTIVEVGSIGGSDVTGTMSYCLDTSELQSASNSVDGDFAADTSVNEGENTSDAPSAVDSSDLQPSTVVPPAPQLPKTVVSPALQSSAAVSPAPQSSTFVAPSPQSSTNVSPASPQSSTFSPPAPQSSTETPAVPSTPEAPVSQPDDTSMATPVVTTPAPADTTDQAPPNPASQSSTVVSLAPECPSLPTSCQSTVPSVSNPPPPPTQGSGSVSESLGRPDPAFLAAHSSPGLLARSYVVNPSVEEGAGPSNSFSLVSYNILAECHRMRSNYSYTPEEFLTQSFRHTLLMKELEYLNGDVVCLQEVGPDYFNNTLLPAFKGLGFDGLLKRRTKEYFDEGEATFYRTSIFELETSKAVSLTEAAHKEVEQGGLSAEVGAAINKHLDQADVVLITRLRVKATGKTVTIGNLHLVWDRLASPDVQCIQAACAIKEVVGMAGSEGAHMICGDFNAVWSSPVYQLVIDGYLSDSSIHTLQAVQRLELNDGAKALVNHLWRAFQHTSSNLKSAYSTVTKSEPEITTFTGNMKKAVDYIFYSAGCLQPLGVLKTIDYAVIDATSGLPTKDFPSDHLSMKAIMSFTK